MAIEHLCVTCCALAGYHGSLLTALLAPPSPAPVSHAPTFSPAGQAQYLEAKSKAAITQEKALARKRAAAAAAAAAKAKAEMAKEAVVAATAAKNRQHLLHEQQEKAAEAEAHAVAMKERATALHVAKGRAQKEAAAKAAVLAAANVAAKKTKKGKVLIAPAPAPAGGRFAQGAAASEVSMPKIVHPPTKLASPKKRKPEQMKAGPNKAAVSSRLVGVITTPAKAQPVVASTKTKRAKPKKAKASIAPGRLAGIVANPTKAKAIPAQGRLAGLLTGKPNAMKTAPKGYKRRKHISEAVPSRLRGMVTTPKPTPAAHSASESRAVGIQSPNHSKAKAVASSVSAVSASSRLGYLVTEKPTKPKVVSAAQGRLAGAVAAKPEVAPAASGRLSGMITTQSPSAGKLAPHNIGKSRAFGIKFLNHVHKVGTKHAAKKSSRKPKARAKRNAAKKAPLTGLAAALARLRASDGGA
jgi:hypothetical protein